jgi:hypothetical protein
MHTHVSALLAEGIRSCRSAWTSLRALLAVDMRSYRPEKFYMRGPGPKWRAKHASGRLGTVRANHLP